MQQSSKATGAFARGIGHLSGAAWFLLLMMGLSWSSLAAAQHSSIDCPPQTATVANGGSIEIDITDCDPYNFGFGNGVPPYVTTPSHGSTLLRQDFQPPNLAISVLTYTHNGNSATSDVFEIRDLDNRTIRFTITISPATSAISVSPASLPALKVAVPFSQTLTSAGGTAPYTYSLSSGSLPVGLSLTSGGVLSGTPTQRVNYNFTVRSQDAGGDFALKTYTGTVSDPDLNATPTPATLIQGVASTFQYTGVGGNAPYSFSISSGSFPPGLTLQSNGQLTGTPTATGTYNVQLVVNDSTTDPACPGCDFFDIVPVQVDVVAPPSVSIALTPASVSEDGATNLTYTLTRSAILSSATVVNITTTGTATSGSDYTGGVATATIPAGATTATITLNPTADGTVEADETAILTVAAGTGYTVGAPSSATGTILNDDVPSATVAVAPASTTEDGAPNLVYTVTLSQAPLVATSVNFTVAGTATSGVDYAAVTSPVVIAAGNTTGTVVVNPAADATIEADETVILTLGAGAGYTVGAPASATGTILNDDLPTLSINDVTANESSTVFTFTVSLSAPAGPGGVTFDAATANGTAISGTDYAAVTSPGLVIPAGTSTYIVNVAVTGDALNELTETFFVNITNVTNAVVGDGQGVGTIVNDDPLPALSIGDVTLVEGNSGTVNAVFTVSLSAPSGQTVSVNYATADGTATAPADYTSTSGTLNLAPLSPAQSITVPVLGEIVPEANETFFVNLSGAVNATISDNQGVGTITNDDVPVTVSPTTVPNGTVAAAYSQSITASGGVAPYTFAITAGALPAGLTLSATGTLSGTPTAAGSFNFTITATDSSAFPGPYSGSRAYTLVINPPTVSLPATPLADGTLGAAYSSSISAASGGTAPYGYAVTAGALPGGLTLNAGTGAISGTPTALGTFNFSVTATDSSTGTGPFTATQAYAITVIDVPPVANAVSVTVPYGAGPTNVPLNITGGTPTSIIGTAASNGSTSTSGLTITYQPNAGYAGPDSFTYIATNSGGASSPATVTVTVSDPVISITPSGGFAATVAAPYTQTFSFNGGAPPWSGYQVTNLPAGLSLTGTTANSVTVSGTPTEAGSFNLNVSATDSSTGNGPYTVGQAFTLTVAAPGLVLAPGSTTFNATYGAPFSQAFAASNGVGPYTYATSGALPAGLTLSGGTLSGTPTAPGSYPITVTATDTGSTGSGAPFTVAQNYTLDVPAPVITIDTVTLPNATAGAAYSQALSASGGVGPYTLAVTAGALPSGLSLSAGGGLSGTSNEVGTFNLTVTATDANGQSGSRAFTLVIAAPTLTMAPGAGTLSAPYGVAYSQAFTAGGSAGPFAYVLTGTLPAGLTFSGNTLSGTPTAPGSFPITVTATDTVLTGAGAPFSIAQNYTLDVPAPSITLAPPTLPDGTAGQAYAATLTASGGVGPYGYAVTAGALPAGMALSSTGALSGTPTASGTFNFTTTATDANGQTGTGSYTLVINVPVLTLTPATLPAGTVAVAYSQSLSTSGGLAPYSYAVSAGTLPAGLTLAADGTLGGTPTTAGSFNFTVTSTDSTGGTAATVSQAYTVDVTNAPPVATNDAATVLAGQSVTIAVTANDIALVPITGISIATAPSEGTAVVSGLDVVYTAPASGSPTVSFTYVATGPGGNSAPATVTVTVNPLPVAAALTANTTPATPVQVVLTTGAAGGPFTGAAVVAVSPAGSGTTSVAASGGNYVLTFTPDSAFTGVAVVRYTLSNAYTTSAEGTVTITVQPRPDPSLDAEVRGLVDAQVESSKRFATTQISNFQQRLERLHSGADGGFDNGIGFAIDRPCIEPLVGRTVDPCNPDRNGFTGGHGLAASASDTGTTASGSGGGGGNGGPIGTWIGGMIRSGSQDGRNGGADIDFETDGLSTGLDYRVNEAFVIGGGFGYGKDENAIGDNGSRVKGDSNTVALYASYHPGSLFVDMLLGYQSLDYDLRRHVTATGGLVNGQRDGSQAFASVSVGADISRETLMFTPYARLDVAQGSLDAYTETGDPVYALSYDEMDVDSSTGNVGVHVDWQFPQTWGRFSPQVRLEYQHDFSGRSDAVMRYADLIGGPVYGLSSTDFDSNRFMVGLGAMFDLDSGWSWRLEYRGQVGSEGESDNAVGVNVQKQF